MYYCISGKHVWLGQDDAVKCCNGFRRLLAVGNVHGCTHIAVEGSTLYGRSWQRDEQQAHDQTYRPRPVQ